MLQITMPIVDLIVFSVIGFATYLAIGIRLLDEIDHPSTKYELMIYIIKLLYWPICYPLLILYSSGTKFFRYWKDLPDK